MLEVTVLSPWWRLVTAALVATSLATLPTYALALVLLPPVPLVVMVRSFALGTALPAAVAWAILRVFRGSAEIRDATLRLRRGDLAIDVPIDSVAGVRPWIVPLPQSGLTLVLRSGKRLGARLALRDPSRLLEELTASGAPAAGTVRHPSVVYAHTRRARAWWQPIVKFPVAGLLPASVLFYTHQHIAYGGTFGQYYLEGFAPYAATFAGYWATTVALLLSYASFWRAAAEGAVWATAAFAPERVGIVRRVGDAICAIAYYGGIPALLALRYMD